MKAVFIQSPCWVVDSPPYNIALLKAVCEKEGHEILCLDFNIKFYKYLVERKEQGIYNNPSNWYQEKYVQEIINKHPKFLEECIDTVLSFDHKVIAFTITGLSAFFSQQIAKGIKISRPENIIIFGGAHCARSEQGEKLLKRDSCIDAVCYREGEKVLPRILDSIEKNNKIEFFPGMAFRDDTLKIIDCSDIELLDDLNALPFADYSDFDVKTYISRELPISTSRGCINKCIFCSETKIWKKYRFRSSENIYDEIVYQISKYPFIRSFFFNDSLINGNIRMTNRLCDLLIENKIDIHWGGQVAIRQEMTKEIILKMKKSGLSHVSYGLETASIRILKLMGKPFTPEVAERVIRETSRAGIRVDVNIIIGFPTEKDEDILFTANFLKRNKKFIKEIFFHPLVITSGSYIYDRLDELGIEYENEFNPNSWYSNKEENTLEKRLETLRFYQDFIDRKGESFFELTDYYLFLAETCFDKEVYDQSLKFYEKAKESNSDKLRNSFIEGCLERIKYKLL